MKRVELAPVNSNPHFIGSWFIEPLTICDALIEFFEAHPQKQTLGKTAGGLDPAAKNSVDLAIAPGDLGRDDHQALRDYINALFACHQDYLEQWAFLKSAVPRVDIGSFNIQRYEPGGHFMKIHSERTALASSHRLLAWMTYLNDVEDGGATEFVHQNLKIVPEKGKTLIWPAEWTHAHRGNVVNSGSKYIITGWMHFPRLGPGDLPT